MKITSPKKIPSTELAHGPLSQETIRSLHELGDVLREIHERLMSEGYIIVEGEFVKPEGNSPNNGDSG